MQSLRCLRPVGRTYLYSSGRPPIRIPLTAARRPRPLSLRPGGPVASFAPRAPQQLPCGGSGARPFAQTAGRRYNPNKWHHPHDDPAYKLAQAKPLVEVSRLRRVARSPRTGVVVLVAVASAFAFYFSNIETVPVSGRRRFNCMSERYVEEVSMQQFRRIIWQVERQGGNFLPEWDPRVRLVRRVMTRLIPFSGMEGAEWEVRVINDNGT